MKQTRICRPSNGVVEVGVGTGAVMAYVSDELTMEKGHIALESNPNLQESLTKTIEDNGLVVTVLPAAIVYNGPSGKVSISISKNLLKNTVRSSNGEETVMVPAMSVPDIIINSNFVDKTNVTIIVEADGLAYEIFNKDQEIRHHVNLVIVGFWGISDTGIFNLINKAAIAPNMTRLMRPT